MDAGLMGMRFMHAICHTADRHGLMPDPAPSPRETSIQAAIGQSPSQVSLRAVPEQGCILVSHPLLRDSRITFFHQTVVLLCRHSFASGTYGLVLNRVLSNEAKARVNDMIKGLDSSSDPASSAGLDLALDMPLAMQAMLDDYLLRAGPASHYEMERAGEFSQSSGEDSGASDEDDDVSFLPEDPTETSIDVSFTATTPASAADKPPDDGKAHTAPLDQGAAEQPGVSSAVERHDQESDSRSSPGHTAPGIDQKQVAKQWQGRIKRPASAAAATDQPAAHASTAPKDIADPKHPLRFHQFITNMKRSPPSPLPADLQDIPEAVSSSQAASHTALSRQQVQPLDTPGGQNDRSPSASPDKRAEASSEAGTSSQEKAEQPGPSVRSSDSESTGPISHPGSSTSQGKGSRQGSVPGKEPGLMNLVPFEVMSRTLSRGGPIPGGQVLHSSPELGGDAVQEPSEGAPGIYVGCDKGRAQQLLNSGQLSDVTMRFFVGEAQWGSQQLETELAQGSWLLLSPSPQLLHDISLKPHRFTDW
ncbi:hypothetical protein ABBQ38_013412 [Trebouxia sp. C0009 RCD-2024]